MIICRSVSETNIFTNVHIIKFTYLLSPLSCVYRMFEFYLCHDLVRYFLSCYLNSYIVKPSDSWVLPVVYNCDMTDFLGVLPVVYMVVYMTGDMTDFLVKYRVEFASFLMKVL